MNEVWKPCSIDEHYEVSSLGRVRSKDRHVLVSGSRRSVEYMAFKAGRLLKPDPTTSGYLQVCISGQRKVGIHRLVAMEFCSGFQSGKVVNHLNGVKTDNRAENLEWITHAENLAHAYEVLGIPKPGKGKFGSEHPGSIAVVGTDMNTGQEFWYGSIREAARDGFSTSGIIHCCKGLYSQHRGRYWRHAENDWQMPALTAEAAMREVSHA